MVKNKMNEKINEKDLINLSHLKRFSEKWNGDLDFRKQVVKDTAQTVSRYNLKLNPEELRRIWNEYFSQNEEQASISPLEKLEQVFSEECQKDVFLAAIPRDPWFKAWRERQIARNQSLYKKDYQEQIIHAPFAVELSKGCSVGCWFCGVSAPRLSDLFLYTPDNAKLWRQVLELLKEILGPSAGAGFCYWATDPLDNPDYEKFCSDFHDILGRFPQTTTALALKNPNRTRSLLKLSRKKGRYLDRFSVVSLKSLNQIHEEFSAEELAFVILALQNPESNSIKANAGKMRERNQRKTVQTSDLDENIFQEDDLSNQGTIACVTGFLFNMVDRTVKLISPCRANDLWPLGYIVFDQGTFSNIDDLKALLEKMLVEHMSPIVKPNTAIEFRKDLQYSKLPDGFQLSTRFMTYKFRHQNYLRELGEVIRKGNKTAVEIAAFFSLFGVPSNTTFQALNLLLARGCLNEEPTPKTVACAQ